MAVAVVSISCVYFWYGMGHRPKWETIDIVQSGVRQSCMICIVQTGVGVFGIIYCLSASFTNLPYHSLTLKFQFQTTYFRFHTT